jgi:hypothetical protein
MIEWIFMGGFRKNAAPPFFDLRAQIYNRLPLIVTNLCATATLQTLKYLRHYVGEAGGRFFVQNRL